MAMAETRTRAFACPSKYFQGIGEFDLLENYTSMFGAKAFFTIDGFLYEGLKERLQKAFENTESSFEAIKFGGECSYAEVDRTIAEFEKAKAQVLVGVGGGKTLDTAKAAADKMEVPVIIVPTSASCDAPCSAMSVMYTDTGEYIHNIRHKRNPEIVLVDTDIVTKAPVRLFVSGMGDALSTVFEGHANRASFSPNYVGKGYRCTNTGVALAELSFEILMEKGVIALNALKQGVCTDAVEDVIEANTLLSGVGFENTSCAAAHGIHAGLTQIPSTHKYLHGEKVAFGVICQMVMENTPKDLFEKVMKFCQEVGLPTTLEELDVEPTEENVMIIADTVVNHNKLIYAEPFKVTVEFVYNSIMAANALGHYYKEH
ncbi:glycerol dehydrogenase [Roseburia hominis]